MSGGGADGQEGPGPCIRVCALGGDGRCLGCRRTPRDFAAWPGGKVLVTGGFNTNASTSALASAERYEP